MMPAARAPGLDTLRLLAVGLVLFAHGGWFLFDTWPVYDAYALAGWLGTELFLALSGFLVTRQLLVSVPARTTTAAALVAWRLWRILPLFWLALLLHLALAQADGRDVAAQPWRYLLLLQNLAAPHPGFFGEAWILPLIVGFTVAVPGLWLAAAAFERPHRAFALLLGGWLLLGIALRAAWVFEHDPAWDEGVRKLVITRIDACVYGALAAVVLPRLRPLPTAALGLVLLGLGAAIFLATARDSSDAARIGCFVVSGTGAAACVAAAWRWAGARSGRIGGTLARLAWPLYLVNMPMLLVMGRAGFVPGGSGAGIVHFVLWLAASFAAAALVHLGLERPWLVLRGRVLSAPAAAATSR